MLHSYMFLPFCRHVHIKDPLQYTEWITRRSVLVAIAATWMVSGLISFLPISLDLHQPESASPTSSTSPVLYLLRQDTNESNLSQAAANSDR